MGDPPESEGLDRGPERMERRGWRKNVKGVELTRVVMEEERRKMPGSRLGHQGKVS